MKRYSESKSRIKRQVLLLLCLGFMLAFSNSAYAETDQEANVVIRLDLSNYDSFDETIEVSCVSEEGNEIQDTLTQYNSYENAYHLPAGQYHISLTVQGDTLHLIDLMPMTFEVDAREDAVQTYTIRVQDAAGMEANEGGHEGMEYEEESAPGAIEAERYCFTEEEEGAGTLLITGPDVTGLESISYTLRNRDGEDITCYLQKEHGFRAELQLPYGRYEEILEPVEVIADEAIPIPEDAEFYFKYYGSKISNLIFITEESKNVTNAENLQLWVRRSNGADYQVRNLYKFAGDAVMQSKGEQEIIGHEVEPEQETVQELRETETVQQPAQEQIEKENQETSDSTEQKGLFKINILLAVIIIAVLFSLLWYGRNHEK